jgi:hypothetical protein
MRSRHRPLRLGLRICEFHATLNFCFGRCGHLYHGGKSVLTEKTTDLNILTLNQKRKFKVMVNNFTNINKTTIRISPQISEHKTYHGIWRWKSR